MRLLLRSALIVAVLALPGIATASGQSEEAEVNFQLGLNAYAAGNYDLALSRFLASNRLAPNPAVAFNIARSYARTRRFAEAYRWYLVAEQGLEDAKALKAVRDGIAQIKPQVVVFDVMSEPPGATVYVDSKDLGEVGATPLSIALPEANFRTFILEREGYEDALVTEVRGRRGDTVTVAGALEQIVGTVKLSGTSGAEVHVGAPDGPLLCTTPCEGELAPGTRVLYLTRDGYQAGVVQLEIAQDQVTETQVELQPETGSVLVDTRNYGALVEVDGEAVGFTPTVAQAVPVGKRTVVISMPGFRPERFTVEVNNDAQVELTDIELAPLNEVTAVSRRRESVTNAPSSVTVLSKAELQAFAYPSVYEALRGVRGFSMNFDSVYGNASIRGLGQAGDFNNRILVLSDGATLNDPVQYQSAVGFFRSCRSVRHSAS